MKHNQNQDRHHFRICMMFMFQFMQSFDEAFLFDVSICNSSWNGSVDLICLNIYEGLDGVY